MGWILDLFKDVTLPLELIPKLKDLEAQFAVLEPENVALKIKIQELEKQIAEIEREKQELQQENQDFRKTKALSHTASIEENTEPEKIENYIEGIVRDSETGDGLHGATIGMQQTTTKDEYFTYSDRYGHFIFPLPFGWYKVTISLSGYLPVTGTCFIRKEQGYYVDYARMEKAPSTFAV